MFETVKWCVATCCVAAATVGCGAAVDESDSENLGSASEALIGSTQHLGFFDAGMWHLDANGDGVDNEPSAILGPFGVSGDVPLVAYGTDQTCGNGGINHVGTYRASTHSYYLDMNNNFQWDGPSVDRTISGFAQEISGATLTPFVWTKKVGTTCQGVVGYTIQQSGAPITWIVDLNDSGVFDAPDLAFNFGGSPGDIPRAIWSAAKQTTVAAVFNTNSGLWILDANANRQWDNCTLDACTIFGLGTNSGSPADFPFASSNSSIRGTSRWLPSQGGLWRNMDENSNGIWDNADHSYPYHGTFQAFLW